jgi:tRNA nucleotidyltransferase (CCA-adding enzyme)
MAYAPGEGYIDPWGGKADLQNKVLRAVGDPTTRFEEDALRILRGVRFAVRFDLTPHPATEEAMVQLRNSMDGLARERVFSELCKLLLDIDSHQLLRYAPIITQVIPELAPCVGFEQHSVHHVDDVYTHTAHVVERTSKELTLRWAALLHDIGKPPCFFLGEDGQGHFHGHASVSAQMADQVLLRLKAPTALRQQVVKLIKLHMNPLQPDKKVLTRQLSKHGWDTMEQLLALQNADFGAHAPDYAPVQQLFEQIKAENACLHIRDLAVGGKELMELGIAPGPTLGALLEKILNRVQEDQLPNEKTAILNYVKKEVDL